MPLCGKYRIWCKLRNRITSSYTCVLHIHLRCGKFLWFFGDGKAPDTLVIHDTARPFPSIGPVVELTDAQLSDVSREQAQTSAAKALAGSVIAR